MKNTLKLRVEALCSSHNSNLRQVCSKIDIPYKSCRAALNDDRREYRNLYKIADYFEVSLDWIRNGNVNELNTQKSGGYINREFVGADSNLKEALDVLDTEKDEEKRKAIQTIVNYYAFSQLTLINALEQYLDIEELLKHAKTPYSASSFKRARTRLNELAKQD